MTNKIPPDWALLEAAKRCGWSLNISSLRVSYTYDAALRALCDMIERYEKPPVDRKLLCAREAIQEAVRARVGWSQEDACIRAIELWEEGFGR